MSTKVILKLARDLIEDKEHWTQGTYAAGSGSDVHPNDPVACIFCAVGAVARVVGITGSEAEDHEAVKLLDELSGGYGIITFNDEHTHTEVLAIFDKAISAAEAA